MIPQDNHARKGRGCLTISAFSSHVICLRWLVKAMSNDWSFRATLVMAQVLKLLVTTLDLALEARDIDLRVYM